MVETASRQQSNEFGRRQRTSSSSLRREHTAASNLDAMRTTPISPTRSMHYCKLGIDQYDEQMFKSILKTIWYLPAYQVYVSLREMTDRSSNERVLTRRPVHDHLSINTNVEQQLRRFSERTAHILPLSFVLPSFRDSFHGVLIRRFTTNERLRSRLANALFRAASISSSDSAATPSVFAPDVPH